MNKTIQNVPAYSAREVVEILEKAKALGVISIKLSGFEAEWEIPRDTETAPEREPEAPAKRPLPTEPTSDPCDVCGEEKIEGQFGLYCRKCYLRRKEEGWKKSKRW